MLCHKDCLSMCLTHAPFIDLFFLLMSICYLLLLFVVATRFVRQSQESLLAVVRQLGIDPANHEQLQEIEQTVCVSVCVCLVCAGVVRVRQQQ